MRGNTVTEYGCPRISPQQNQMARAAPPRVKAGGAHLSKITKGGAASVIYGAGNDRRWASPPSVPAFPTQAKRRLEWATGQKSGVPKFILESIQMEDNEYDHSRLHVGT